MSDAATVCEILISDSDKFTVQHWNQPVLFNIFAKKNEKMYIVDKYIHLTCKFRIINYVFDSNQFKTQMSQFT